MSIQTGSSPRTERWWIRALGVSVDFIIILGLALSAVAILEVVGIGSIIPFTTLLMQPDALARHPQLAEAERSESRLPSIEAIRRAVRRSGAAPRAERGPGEERAGVTEARVRRHPTQGSYAAGTAPPGPRSGGGRDARSEERATSLERKTIRCGRRDLNPHAREHRNLNPACLPVPPLPRNGAQPNHAARDAPIAR